MASAGVLAIEPVVGVPHREFLTDPGWRGRGLAAAAGGALIELLRQRGFSDIRQGVNSDNSHARRLYERLGFALLEERELLLSHTGISDTRTSLT